MNPLISVLKKPVSRPVLALAAIGMLDMLGTTYGLATGKIGEANPFLNWVLSFGLGWFIAVKTFFVAWPCAVFVAVGPKATPYVKIGIIAYLAILAVGILLQV